MARYKGDEYPRYSQPTAQEIRSRAEKTANTAKKKGQELHPVSVSGRSITQTWWGNAWCRNLERYADYASRIGRGRSYVRSGAVVDLQIQKGIISASVQGSRRTPYQVRIEISPLEETRRTYILSRCARKIENLESLLAGDFPKELQALFTGKDGLFPASREIRFQCSCPDWASMCKHVAAALYGVGVRLDETPLLFFELRGIEVQQFIDVAVTNRVEAMLQNAKKGSSRILPDQELSQLFGIL